MDVTDQGWSADTKYSLTGGLSNNAISISETNTYMNRVHIDTIRLSPYYNPINGESAYIALDQSDPTDLANAEMIQASLRVAIKVPSGLIRKDVIMPIILKLNKEKTKIIDCNSLEGSVNMAAICTSMGGDWDYEALNCSQPCPPNMIKSEGVCVKKDHEDDKNVVIHCKAADACVVSDLYKSP